MDNKRKWHKGDTHLHTINSDGVLTKGQLVDACKKAGLDFMIITDHNFNSVEKSYYDGDILVMQGQELTSDNGHVNIWGKKIPFEPPYNLETKENYEEIIAKCHEIGATVSLNHPFCSQCGFRFNIDDIYCDCVEVWNTIMHSDNITNRDWWVEQLMNGRKISAIGGSDYHRNYAGKNILAHPTTYVFAEDKTEDSILLAMREGRAFVTNSPNSTELYLKSGTANVGDTVKFDEKSEVSLFATNLLPNQTIKIYNNKELIYSEKITKPEKAVSISTKVAQKGFVRAEIEYKFTPILKKVYAFAETTFLKGKNSGNIPPFIWAFTNPIYFE